MDVTYRRRHPAGRLERLLARLVPARSTHEPVAIRVDFVLGDGVEVKQV
ncbi:hypothetical protein [Nocardioides pocheonensis]|nr:hypothetical protein [Nocardioides pocheonensis]